MGWGAQGFGRFAGEALQARNVDSQGSLETGGESRPCDSLGLVKDVTVYPQGPAQLATSAALMFWGMAGWLLISFSQAHAHTGNYTSKGAIRRV